MLLVVDIVGNTLVILVILNYRDMKTAMNYLLLNLAIADIMVGTFFAPHFLFSVNLFTHPSGTVGNVLCKTLTGENFSWIASLASGFTLVYVAVERFYAIVHPTSIRQKITKRKLKRIVPACWILATLITIPSISFKTFYEGDPGEENCRTILTAVWQYVTYDFLWLVSAAIIPVTVMAVLYSRVVYTLWQNNNGDNTRLVVINARKRITGKCITISFMYSLCVFPVHILYFVSRLYPDVFTFNDLFFKTAYCLLVLNSLVNPFIYTFQCRKFQKYLKRLICRVRCVQHSRTIADALWML